MAGPLALALVLGLASLSFVMRATGSFLPSVPSALTERMAGLAPALLAALVAIQVTGPNGLIHLDVKVPAVLLAGVLAALRAHPLSRRPLLAMMQAGEMKMGSRPGGTS